MTGTDISRALGAKKDNAALQIYHRHKKEFKGKMSLTLILRCGGNSGRKTRVFNARGAQLISMLCEAERAAEFREWILDVLEEKRKAEPVKIESKKFKNL